MGSDVKPGNILFDHRGHLVLTDFGCCARLDPATNTVKNVDVPVGTVDYIAPEVLLAMDASHTSGKGTYGPECDWWSAAIVAYECLCGDPPFYGDSIAQTYARILAHNVCSLFPFFGIGNRVRES